MVSSSNHSSIILCASLLVGVASGILTGKIFFKREAAPNSIHRNENGWNSNYEKADRASRELSQILQLSANKARVQALVNYYSKLSFEQLRDEARALNENEPSQFHYVLDEHKTILRHLLFGRLVEIDPVSTMDLVKGFGENHRHDYYLLAIKGWANLDPQGAARYLEGEAISIDDTWSVAARAVASEWAKFDVTQALHWAKGLPKHRESTISAVLTEMAIQSPEKALSMIEAMDLSDPQEAYAAIAYHYSSKDFAAAKAWISSLPQDQQHELMAAAITSLAASNFESAVAELGVMPDSNFKRIAASKILKLVSRDNPLRAAKLISSDSTPKILQNKLPELIENWYVVNPAEAEGYLFSLPDGSARDQAITRYMDVADIDDPDKLIKLAGSISDGNVRENTVVSLFDRLEFTHPEEALRLLESADIADKKKEQLRTQLLKP